MALVLIELESEPPLVLEVEQWSDAQVVAVRMLDAVSDPSDIISVNGD